jgi:two-component system phosphate regulon sensor histidine kinase PhoR
MAGKKTVYRKNFFLILAFLALISISLVAALSIDYSLTKKHIENEFSSQKISVLEESIKPYTEFFSNRIPEISYYQGYLDSSSVVKYVDTVFSRFLFVQRVVFYDTRVSNRKMPKDFRVNHLSIAPKAIYTFSRDPDSTTMLYKESNERNDGFLVPEDFNRIAAKFSGFIQSADTTQAISPSDQVNFFYILSQNRITYMSNPRKEELRIFRDLMTKKLPPSPVYEQDVLTFFLDPSQLNIRNTHPELYEDISIKPVTYDQVDGSPGVMSTDIQLPGAFSAYKLYFTAPAELLNKEVNRRFLPIAAGFVLIYAILVFLAWLIYRNLNINQRMFKLQYDFINNFTHEFKTPVSVIKIAGNNIRSSQTLSDKERLHYGKILDEEADKLNELMNKLLSFTQIENRAIRIREEEISLGIFIQNVIDEFQLKYPDFMIDYELPEDAAHFLSDPVLLGSVFRNLIDNAYKYSPPERRELFISVAKEGPLMKFSFTDQGIGIPKSEIGNIFKKFYRIQSQYNQQGSAGLGLAFCKELANFMGGDIEVASREKLGSTFTLYLPITTSRSNIK